jgi:carboxymethylenebutenolidase
MSVNAALETAEIVCANGMPAFLACPKDAQGPLPVVVLMHERYGLVQHTRDQAMRCARDGYFVLAPNFFFRHSDQAALNKGDSRYDMTDPDSVELMDAALAAIGKDSRADMGRVAVAGYCQTGRHPLIYASQRDIKLVVIWYGAASKREWEINARQPEALDTVIARVKCRVFAAFGALDHIISIDDVTRLRNAFEASRLSYHVAVYAGAPHGWLNDTMPGRYRKAQAEAGWDAQQKFLAERLKGDGAPDLVSWRFESDINADYDFSKNKRLE